MSVGKALTVGQHCKYRKNGLKVQKTDLLSSLWLSIMFNIKYIHFSECSSLRFLVNVKLRQKNSSVRLSLLILLSNSLKST